MTIGEVPPLIKKEGNLFLIYFFLRQVLEFFVGSWFYAFLLLWFSASLLFCFSASLLFLLLCFSCFSASLLLCFSASLLFLLLCFSAFCFPCSSFFVLLCLSTSTILFSSSVMCFCCSTSCSSASLLPVFTVSLFFSFFCFILSCLHPKWNPRETLGETQKLDDGWPESVEEQGLLLLVWRHHMTKQYIKDVL